jgi:putative NADPH-quinone reductase
MSFDDLLHHVTWGTFHYVGMDVLKTFVSYASSTVSEEERKKRLEILKESLKHIDKYPYMHKF